MSLRDDEQGKSQEPGSASGCAHMTRLVVAQNFADVTFLSSITRTRWSFLEANVPVVVSFMKCK